MLTIAFLAVAFGVMLWVLQPILYAFAAFFRALHQ
jgi:hypothetical protein